MVIFCMQQKRLKIRKTRLGMKKGRLARRNVKAAWEDYRRVLERIQERKQEARSLRERGVVQHADPVGGGSLRAFRQALLVI